MASRKHAVAAFIAVCAITTLIAACGGGGGGGSGNNNPPGDKNGGVVGVRTTASDALFTDAPDPVDVTVVPDPAKAVSQAIGPAGGTLNTTGADGSQFTLQIPAGALQQTTTITMTPISSVVGLPFDGLVAGVQFAPDGLQLAKNATLTIVPSVNVPVGQQTFLGYSGSGTDLHMLPPASSGQAIQLLISHFSGGLVADGTAAQRGTFYTSRAQQRGSRLEHEVATVLGQGRQKQILGVSDGIQPNATIDNFFSSYWALVMSDYLAAAGTSCAAAKRAQAEYLWFWGQLQIMGTADSNSNPYDPNGAVYQQILNAVDTTCNVLPNRYSGTFTASQTSSVGGVSAAGNVTFLRDDAACTALGVDASTMACYRVESVSYTSTPTAMAGCSLSPASHDVTLANTPVSDSVLAIELTSTPTGTRKYTVVAHWSDPYSVTVTCPPSLTYGATQDGWAALASNPVQPTTDSAQQITGSYAPPASSASISYSWNLSAAP